MVLRRVGATDTEVEVNGVTEFGPTTQLEDSRYDVDVNISGETVSGTNNGSEITEGDERREYLLFVDNAGPVDFTWSLSTGDFSAAQFVVGGTVLDSINENESTSGSTTITDPGLAYVYIDLADNSDGTSVDWESSYEFTRSASFDSINVSRFDA